MTAALAFLPEAEYPGLLAGARASCPHGGGVADAGHRYVFWLASDTLARAAAPAAPDLLFSADLALLVSRE